MNSVDELVFFLFITVKKLTHYLYSDNHVFPAQALILVNAES
jgi:hypothetical protein